MGQSSYQEICKNKLDEIEPSIRYCNYNLKGKKSDSESLIQMKLQSQGMDSVLQAKLDVRRSRPDYSYLVIQNVIAESLKKQSEAGFEVVWKGNKLPVKNEKFRMYILTAQEASYELEKVEIIEQKLPIYDKLFVACNDAIRVAKDDLAEKVSNFLIQMA